MKNSKLKNLICLIINAFIVISTFIITVGGLTAGAGNGQPGSDLIRGKNYFMAFTIDSNILAGFCSMIVLVFNITNLVENKDELPAWVKVVHYVGAVAVSLTFLTVVFFLAPVSMITSKTFSSGVAYFTNDMFFFHFFNPIISVVSVVLLGCCKGFSFKENLFGLIPTVLYSFVYLIMVVFVGTWPDFYGFTFGGHFGIAPVSMIVMYGATYLIGLIIIKLCNKVNNF